MSDMTPNAKYPKTDVGLKNAHDAIVGGTIDLTTTISPPAHTRESDTPNGQQTGTYEVLLPTPLRPKDASNILPSAHDIVPHVGNCPGTVNIMPMQVQSTMLMDARAAVTTAQVQVKTGKISLDEYITITKPLMDIIKSQRPHEQSVRVPELPPPTPLRSTYAPDTTASGCSQGTASTAMANIPIVDGEQRFNEPTTSAADSHANGSYLKDIGPAISMYPGPTLGKSMGKKNKKKKQAKNQKVDSEGGRAHGLCVKCWRIWTAEFISQNIPSIVLPGDHKKAMGLTICPTQCGGIPDGVVTKTYNGECQYNTMPFNQVFVENIQLSLPEDVTIMSRDNEIAFFQPSQIASWTKFGGTVTSLEFGNGVAKM